MSGGIFGSLFDLNGDGKVDGFEQGLEFMALQHLMDSKEDGDTDDDLLAALEAAGLSYGDLMLMDEDERRDALEEAGLDPDEFYF